MILLSKTYTEITPESAEDGDTSDGGFIWEDAPCTFRELISYLKEHTQPSCYPLKESTISPYLWFSTGYYTEDYTTGTEREECLHYSRLNDPKAYKYWVKAIKYVHGLNRITK